MWTRGVWVAGMGTGALAMAGCPTNTETGCTPFLFSDSTELEVTGIEQLMGDHVFNINGSHCTIRLPLEGEACPQGWNGDGPLRSFDLETALDVGPCRLPACDFPFHVSADGTTLRYVTSEANELVWVQVHQGDEEIFQRQLETTITTDEPDGPGCGEREHATATADLDR